jgi:hypothetical protein
MFRVAFASEFRGLLSILFLLTDPGVFPPQWKCQLGWFG